MKVSPPRSEIVEDNESVTASYLEHREFAQAFLLTHALIEALLWRTLSVTRETTFSRLVKAFEGFLEKNYSGGPKIFVDELSALNQRRNRIVHELWKKRFTRTNDQAEPAAYAAVALYGLLNEFMATFDLESFSGDFNSKTGQETK